jgi:hypothetical protein
LEALSERKFSEFIVLSKMCILERGTGSPSLRKKKFFLLELGFEFRASHLQSRYSTAWAIPLVHFALVILEMGSCILFAWAGLNFSPQSPK